MHPSPYAKLVKVDNNRQLVPLKVLGSINVFRKLSYWCEHHKCWMIDYRDVMQLDPRTADIVKEVLNDSK